MSVEPHRRLLEAPRSIPRSLGSTRTGLLAEIYPGNLGEAPRPSLGPGVGNSIRIAFL